MKLTVLLGLALCAPLFWTPSALAVDTRNWTLSEQADFEKGNLKGLTLRNDGRLRVAPAVRELHDAATPYLWTIVQDSKGVTYSAGGGPASKARVFAIESGKARVFAELEDGEIHSLALNARDELFAATSPDGKVYKVTAGKAEVFYDPKAKYIWALTFDKQGRLYVATGDQGEIHRVDASGRGSVFFRLDEAHARSLALDSKDQLIVGTEPGGLVIRVDAAGNGFVIYQSSKREITALAVTKNDEIFLAGVGQKVQLPGTPPVGVTPAPPPPQQVAPVQGQPGAGQQAQRIAVGPPPTFGPVLNPVSGGSEVYRLDADGAPLKYWANGNDVIYALALDAEGRPWIGTGNKGQIYRLESPYLFTLLPPLPSTQVTALAAGRQGQLLAATGNVGKIYAIGPDLEKEGSLESEVLDVGSFSLWGRLQFEASGNGIAFQTRSGNLERPQRNWSPWAALNNGRVASPAARFLQWKVTLAPAAGNSPELKWVDVAYQPKNVPPRVEEVEATPQNYKFPGGGASAMTANTNLTLRQLGRTRPRAMVAQLAPAEVQPPGIANYSRGSIAVRWLAADDNGDDLSFKVEMKAAKDLNWKLVKDKVTDRFLNLDATSYPDGEYHVRVTASDQPSNPPGQGLASSEESDTFWIDNTAPVISNISAEPASTKINLRFQAKDALSTIAKAEYSVNGGDWMIAEPTTKLTDSQEHEYHLLVDRPGFGEITVAVRVTDSKDNQAVAKTVLSTTER